MSVRTDEREHPTRRPDSERILWLVVGATFAVSLSNNTLGVAIPVVVRHFHASALAATLIVLTPSLASTTLMLGLGRVGDLFGRRASYLGGLAAFALASALLGVAPSPWAIVALQVVQAVGVATVWANSAAILTEQLAPAQLRRGLGLYIAAIAVAELIGPSLGGAIAETIGWRWVFWVDVPTGLLCSLAGRALLPHGAPPGARRRLDLAGTGLIVAGLSGLILSVSFVESTGHLAAGEVVGLLASLLVIAAFVLWERRRDSPLLDLGLFRNGAFSFVFVAGMLNAMASWGPVLLMVLYFQAVRGDSPLRAGLIVIPLPVMTGTFSALAGRLGRFASSAGMSVLGGLLVMGGLGFLAWALAQPYPAIAAALGIVGVGGGIFMPANANELMRRAPVKASGSVNAARLTAMNVGWVTSTAVVLALAVSQLPAGLRRHFFSGTVAAVSSGAVHELVAGYRYAVALLAVFALGSASCAVAAVLRREGASTLSAG